MEGSRGRGTTYAVPEPVGGGGQADAAGADGEREDLAHDDPRGGTPCHGEHGNVNANKGNHGGDGGLVLRVGLPRRDADDADDELRNDHAAAADDEDHAPAEALDDPKGERGGEDVDEGGDEGDEEGVLDGAEGLEEDDAEVEDEVDARELLHHLHEDSWEG